MKRRMDTMEMYMRHVCMSVPARHVAGELR